MWMCRVSTIPHTLDCLGSGANTGGLGCAADGVSPTERHVCGVWSGVFVEEPEGIEGRMSSSRAGSVDFTMGTEANRLELRWCPGVMPDGAGLVDIVRESFNAMCEMCQISNGNKGKNSD